MSPLISRLAIVAAGLPIVLGSAYLGGWFLFALVAVGGLQVGTLVAYTLLTETVYQWPGMGFLFLEAVTRADIPLITTYLVFVGLLFVITNTLVDVLSLMLDPRISLEGTR